MVNMEIISKKDPVEKIEDLNRKGKIKTISLTKNPDYPTTKHPWTGGDLKAYEEGWERIYGHLN